MPKHYAINANIMSGTVVFNNSKTAVIQYGTTFPKKPIVQLTLDHKSAVPPYKSQVKKNKVTIKFKTKFTGSVEWTAIER